MKESPLSAPFLHNRYLEKRKEEIKAEIAAAQHNEDSDLSGAIPEKERLETLQKLIQSEFMNGDVTL